MDTGDIVLCNPPFEDFTTDDRSRYSIANAFPSKPRAVLQVTLDAHPQALAFVLPRPFVLNRGFAAERRRIEQLYAHVELLSLPDDLFAASRIESTLLIAREPRPPAPAVVSLRSSEVADQDRAEFLRTGRTTRERRLKRPIGNPPTGDLWIPPLPELWQYLASAPRLDAHFAIHRGIEWKSTQEDAWSKGPRAGYRRGLHNARGARQFAGHEAVFLDCRAERLRGRAIELDWDRAKLVVNAARLSRKAWRIAAVVDRDGLVCSQQFLGCGQSDGLRMDNCGHLPPC